MKWMREDNSGWKWMKMDEMDESGGKRMESGWKWMKVDIKGMKMVGSGWNGMKMNESWWKWMNSDESCWEWMKEYESGRKFL